MQQKKDKGQLIVLSGPSGVGKSTVIAELLSQRKNIYFSVSYTTRQPRVGEQDGVNYNFVDRAEFERMIAADELLEVTPKSIRIRKKVLDHGERMKAAAKKKQQG